MKLLSSGASPFSRKARIVLEEKRIAYELVLARPSLPDSPVPAHNPLGKVPVLVTDAGKSIYDSSVIADYLDALVPEPRLIPAALEERVDVKRWEALGDGILDATVLTSHDYDKTQSAEWHQKQRLKIDRGLAAMSKELGEREFCHGNSFSLADIAAGCALGYIDRVLQEIDWRASHPNLARLADRLAQRESFRKTVPTR